MPECRRHHRLKHQADTPAPQAPGGTTVRPWQLTAKSGYFLWTSPEGLTYRVEPERLMGE